MLPTIKRSYNDELNKSIAENSQELSDINTQYNELSNEYDALTADYNDVSQKLNAYEAENAAFTDIYEKLNSIISDYNAGNIEDAVASYTSIDRSLVTAEPLLSQLQSVDRVMLNDAFNQLVENGTNNWNGGNYSQAEYYYKLALEIKSDDPEAMYLLARLYQSQERIAEANALFDRIVGEHPESSYAQRAVDARGY